MVDILLKRVSKTPQGVFGVMMCDADQIPFAVTLELPWKENKANISCIPEGAYVCIKQRTKKHGIVYVVQNVPKRKAILIHKGNVTQDTEGCILIGEKYEWLSGRPAIQESTAAFDEFMNKILAKQIQFNLIIREV